MLSDVQLLVICILSFLDSMMTYEWVVHFRKLNPKIPFEKVEGNRMIRWSWKKFGIIKGSIFSGFILFALQCALASIHLIAFWIITIILVAQVINHIQNFYIVIKREKKGRKKKNGRNKVRR